MTKKEIKSLEEIFELSVIIRREQGILNNLKPDGLLGGRGYRLKRSNDLQKQIGIFCTKSKEIGLKNYLALLS